MAPGRKREHVAREMRARIERGCYTDGEPLYQSRLAAEFGVHHCVIWSALAELQRSGLVTLTLFRGQQRFVVNATHVSQQLQRTVNLAERLTIMARQLDTLCVYTLPREGPYAAPRIRLRWMAN